MDVIGIGETMIVFTPDTNGPMRYARNFSSRIAGAETNTLIGLSKLGYQTGWISKVGNDEFGASILSFVRGEGVDVSRVKIEKQAPTGILFKEMANQQSVNVYYYRKNSAASLLAPDDIDPDYIRQAKYLFITGITPALSDSCKETIFSVIEIAKYHSVPVVFDPNLRRKLWTDDEAKRVLIEIAKKADIILPGVSEGEFLFATKNSEEIAASFHQLGAKMVIVKLGEKGAYYSTDKEKAFVPALHVEHVVDPVGAGDGFAAGFLSGLLDHLSINEAVKRGCTIGALVTTVFGDVEGQPNRETLQTFMSSARLEDVHR
jgi:2-dehydro-3-deoxygluconokinase